MREDMQYISGVLDELEAIVQDASGVPMSKGRVVVDRSDLLVMLDELRGSLPPELAEAESLRRECGATVAAAEEEALRMIEEAHRHADAMVPETELLRRTGGLPGPRHGTVGELVPGLAHLGGGVQAGVGRCPRAPACAPVRGRRGEDRRSGLAGELGLAIFAKRSRPLCEHVRFRSRRVF